MATALDDFSGWTNGQDLNGAWTQTRTGGSAQWWVEGAWSLSGDALYKTTTTATGVTTGSSTAGCVFRNDISPGGSQYSEITLAISQPNAIFPTVFIRASGADTTLSGYAAFYDGYSDNLVLLSGSSNSWTEIGTAASGNTGGFAATDVIRLEGSGTTIRVLFNDVQKISVTDATHSTGSVGFGIRCDTTVPGVVSEWGGGDLGSSIVPQAMANYRMRAA